MAQTWTYQAAVTQSRLQVGASSRLVKGNEKESCNKEADHGRWNIQPHAFPTGSARICELTCTLSETRSGAAP
jgi:hypothetical protein